MPGPGPPPTGRLGEGDAAWSSRMDDRKVLGREREVLECRPEVLGDEIRVARSSGALGSARVRDGGAGGARGVLCSQENIANQQPVISPSHRGPPIPPRRPPVPLFQSPTGGAQRPLAPRVRNGATVSGDVGRAPSLAAHHHATAVFRPTPTPRTATQVLPSPRPAVSVAQPAHDCSFRRGPPLPYHPYHESQPHCPPISAPQLAGSPRPMLARSGNALQHLATGDPKGGTKENGTTGSLCTRQQTTLGQARTPTSNGASRVERVGHIQAVCQPDNVKTITGPSGAAQTATFHADKRKRPSSDAQDTEAHARLNKKPKHLSGAQLILPSVEIDGGPVDGGTLSGKGGAKRAFPLAKKANGKVHLTERTSPGGKDTDVSVSSPGSKADMRRDVKRHASEGNTTNGTGSRSPGRYHLRCERRGASSPGPRDYQRQREVGAPSPDPR